MSKLSKPRPSSTGTLQVIVTSPGDTDFEDMSTEMEGLLKSNANLESAGIREA